MSFLSLNTITKTGKGIVTAIICASALGFSAAQAQQTVTSNTQGTHNGFFYSFWKDSGDASFGLYEGGRYTSQWNSSTNNWVGGKGWNPGGRRVVHYEGQYNVNNSQNTYLALYGWTRSPLVEYYVIESYGSYNPSNCTQGRQTYGTFQSDGASYEIVRCQRVQQPSIDGTQTFYQYFSVRQPKKGFGSISGTITVGNHFDAWASVGLNLGNHDYMVLATEGYQSTGSSDITVSEGAGGGSGGGNAGGGSSGSGSNTLVIRAVGTSGNEQLRVNVGGNTIETLNLSTSWQDFTVNTNATGDINVELFDDQGQGYEIRVDYMLVNGDTRYAEDQSYNTSAWDGECGGGSNTQWMHCNGMIGFGDMTGGGSTGGGSTGGGSSGANTLVIRAVGTSGNEQLRVNVGGSAVETLNLSTSWQDYTVNTNATGDINVELFNDQGQGYEARIDYMLVNGDTRYAADQSYNTSAWDGECGGGSYTQWMHCDGMIGFGDMTGN
ncbi:MAG TPA: glycoside hydrolase family 11 protein [Cellvibrionaceae bacterium]